MFYKLLPRARDCAKCQRPREEKDKRLEELSIPNQISHKKRYKRGVNTYYGVLSWKHDAQQKRGNGTSGEDAFELALKVFNTKDDGETISG